MLYSASRRSDLPAFYPDYIVEKIKRSRKLEGVVYWTKDVRNLAFHSGLRAALMSYPSIIQYTVTGLAGSVWEPNVAAYTEQRDALAELAEELPAGALRWRFDPIIADETLFSRFTRINNFFSDIGIKFDSIVVSFPDIYRKVGRRLRDSGVSIPALSLSQQREILATLYRISGIKLALCCEDALLDLPFVKRSSCIDAALFKKLYGIEVSSRPDTGQRKECGCTLATDIGSYAQVCKHNCLYCYANPEI